MDSGGCWGIATCSSRPRGKLSMIGSKIDNVLEQTSLRAAVSCIILTQLLMALVIVVLVAAGAVPLDRMTAREVMARKAWNDPRPYRYQRYGLKSMFVWKLSKLDRIFNADCSQRSRLFRT